MRKTHARDPIYGATKDESGIFRFITMCGREVEGIQISSKAEEINCRNCWHKMIG